MWMSVHGSAGSSLRSRNLAMVASHTNSASRQSHFFVKWENDAAVSRRLSSSAEYRTRRHQSCPRLRATLAIFLSTASQF